MVAITNSRKMLKHNEERFDFKQKVIFAQFNWQKRLVLHGFAYGDLMDCVGTKIVHDVLQWLPIMWAKKDCVLVPALIRSI